MNPQKEKALLQGAIQDLTDCKWFFSNNPQTDFSRNRKLSFEQVVQAILCILMTLRGSGGSSFEPDYEERYGILPQYRG